VKKKVAATSTVLSPAQKPQKLRTMIAMGEKIARRNSIQLFEAPLLFVMPDAQEVHMILMKIVNEAALKKKQIDGRRG
jgi:hypothetical protein